jgi:hypothetical protein
VRDAAIEDLTHRAGDVEPCERFWAGHVEHRLRRLLGQERGRGDAPDVPGIDERHARGPIRAGESTMGRNRRLLEEVLHERVGADRNGVPADRPQRPLDLEVVAPRARRRIRSYGYRAA